jgi:hypothetical protein
MQLEEGTWHHLAIMYGKLNALAGLVQYIIAHFYNQGSQESLHDINHFGAQELNQKWLEPPAFGDDNR